MRGQFIYIINSVDNTNLPSHILPPTQHHGFFRDLAPYSFNLTFYLLLLFQKQFYFLIFQNVFSDP